MWYRMQSVPRAPAHASIAPGERLQNLDVLRAIALLGVLAVNLLTEFRVSIFEQFLRAPSGSPLDRAIDRAVAIGIENKAFILFSILFGVGLAIQFDRARRSGRAFGAYATRRLGALLAIGLAHLVFVWNGDILTEYAIAGFLALPLLCCGQRVLLGIALSLFALFVAPLPYPEPFANGDAMLAHIEAANTIYRHGSWGAIQTFRIRELWHILPLDIGVLPRTLGLFAFGIWASRAGIFERSRERAGLFVGTAVIGLVVGGTATLLSSGVFGEVSLAAWESAVGNGGAILLALGYGAVVFLVHDRPLGRRALAALLPVGRMALTNYLTQSIVFGFIFYGYGLGLFGTMSVTRGALLGISVYGLQASASGWWLRRFRFGPVEWLWRSATYGAWQRLRAAGPEPATERQ
jgi:uncharacterized protein